MPDANAIPDNECDEDSCWEPCDPDAGCPRCDGYWERMVNEGLWDREQHKWTEAGWKNIILRA